VSSRSIRGKKASAEYVQEKPGGEIKSLGGRTNARVSPYTSQNNGATCWGVEEGGFGRTGIRTRGLGIQALKCVVGRQKGSII
jgi:hypothetical protein